MCACAGRGFYCKELGETEMTDKVTPVATRIAANTATKSRILGLIVAPTVVVTAAELDFCRVLS